MIKLQHEFDMKFWVFGCAVAVSVINRHLSIEIGLGPVSFLIWIGK